MTCGRDGAATTSSGTGRRAKLKSFPGYLTDERGVVHSVSIPPPLIRREAIARMREAAERLLAPQCRVLVRLIDEPLLQPIYDLASPRLAFGRVALVGDAAFVARPHVGAGVSKAADDAAALAQALDGDDVEAALRRYEQERLPENNRIIERARHLGAYLQATKAPRSARGRRNMAFRKRCWRKRRWWIFCTNDRRALMRDHREGQVQAGLLSG